MYKTKSRVPKTTIEKCNELLFKHNVFIPNRLKPLANYLSNIYSNCYHWLVKSITPQSNTIFMYTFFLSFCFIIISRATMNLTVMFSCVNCAKKCNVKCVVFV